MAESDIVAYIVVEACFLWQEKDLNCLSRSADSKMLDFFHIRGFLVRLGGFLPN